MAKTKNPIEEKTEAKTQAEIAEAAETGLDLTPITIPPAEGSGAEPIDVAGPGEASDSEPSSDSAEAKATKVTKAGKHSAKAMAEADAETKRKEAARSKPDTDTLTKVARQKPNPLKAHGKNYRKAAELIDRSQQYELAEAIELAQKTANVKFDASLELHLNLGVDPRQADQMVRASVILPSGTGKSLKVAVVAPVAKHADAKKAGADLIGEDDLIAKIEKGQLGFDRLIATPDMMPKLSKVAKILGPRGLMPNPKSGTVATDVVKAINEAKQGKVEFRIDKQAIIHQAFGKASFKSADLLDNAKVLIDAVIKAKPSAAKGTYVKSISMASSMGPGIKINVSKALAEANPKTK